MTDAPISAGYVALIPLAPLVGATVLGLGGAALQRRVGKGPIGLIACGTIALSFVLSLVAFVQLLGLEPEHRVPGLLADLLPYQRPLRTVLGFSSGAIPTILTGLPPARTGHWNLFYYDPKGSPFQWLRLFRFLPKKVLDHRVTRKIVKELGRRVLGMGPLFECCVSPALLPWFNWVNRARCPSALARADS